MQQCRPRWYLFDAVAPNQIHLCLFGENETKRKKKIKQKKLAGSWVDPRTDPGTD